MAKRKYSWIGGAISIEPETDAGTTVTEVIQLVPAQQVATIVGARTEMLIEAIYLHFSVHRLLITEVDALAFLVYQASVTETGNTPSQALNALSLIDRDAGNKRIMMHAPLAFPGINHSGDLATAQVTEEGMVAHHEYQAMRKHDRASQVLCMTINSDVSLVFNVFAQWRVLVSW